MKIDIITKDVFNSYEQTMRTIVLDLRTEVNRLRKLVMALQDRIQILEIRGDNENKFN